MNTCEQKVEKFVAGGGDLNAKDDEVPRVRIGTRLAFGLGFSREVASRPSPTSVVQDEIWTWACGFRWAGISFHLGRCSPACSVVLNRMCCSIPCVQSGQTALHVAVTAASHKIEELRRLEAAVTGTLNKVEELQSLETAVTRARDLVDLLLRLNADPNLGDQVT